MIAAASRLLASTSIGLVLLLGPQVASAQEAHAGEAQDEASTSGIEDIVVTATRREARLQQVPVAVTATGTSARSAALTPA